MLIRRAFGLSVVLFVSLFNFPWQSTIQRFYGLLVLLVVSLEYAHEFKIGSLVSKLLRLKRLQRLQIFRFSDCKEESQRVPLR